MSGVVFGWMELILGAVGLILGMLRKINRSSSVISLGLVVVGVSNMAHGRVAGVLTDIGGLILLFGLGMSISAFRRARKDRGK